MVVLKSFVLFAFVGYVFAAPKPIDWDNVGRKVKEFGDKTLEIAGSACDYIRPQQHYPQFPRIQPTYYHPTSRGFPQAPGFPVYYPPTRINPTFYYPNYYPNPSAPRNTPNNGFPNYPSNPRPQTPSLEPVNPIPSSTTLAPESFTTIEQNDLNAGDNGIPPYIPPSNDDDNGNVEMSLVDKDGELQDFFNSYYSNRL